MTDCNHKFDFVIAVVVDRDRAKDKLIFANLMQCIKCKTVKIMEY